MDISTAKKIIGDDTLSDDTVSVLLSKAKKLAKNHHFWKSDDEPTDAELEKFYERYEYEIYEIAKATVTASERGDLKQYSELGVTRIWGGTGAESINTAVNAIPTKTYIL